MSETLQTAQDPELEAILSQDELQELGIDVRECSALQKETLVRQRAFLAAYATCGTVTAASDTAGIHQFTVRRWRAGDVFGFRDRMEKAHEAYGDHLEDEMHRRIFDPEGNRGSDILLIFDLKAAKPDKYRENVQPTDDHAKQVWDKLMEMVRGSAPHAPETETLAQGAERALKGS